MFSGPTQKEWRDQVVSKMDTAGNRLWRLVEAAKDPKVRGCRKHTKKRQKLAIRRHLYRVDYLTYWYSLPETPKTPRQAYQYLSRLRGEAAGKPLNPTAPLWVEE